MSDEHGFVPDGMRITERGVLIGAIGALFALSCVLMVVTGFVPGFSFPGSEMLAMVAFGGAGAVITRTRPGNAVGRIFLWIPFVGLVNQVTSQLAVVYPEQILALIEGSLAGRAVVVVVHQTWWIVILLIFSSLAVFPDGDWPSRTGQALHLLFAASFGLSAVFDSQTLDLAGADVRLLPWLPQPVLSALSVVSGVCLSVVLALVVWKGLRSGPIRRRQTGWVLWMIGMLILVMAVSEPLLGDEAGAAFAVVFALIPMSVMAAVTQYKLYEIDRIVSRTVSYVVVIGLLGGAYAGLVLALRSVVPVEGPLPVALSTLAVAFAFFPLLKRVQRVVDRRFFRSRYDAAGVVAAFADELRSTLDPGVAASRAEAVVGQTFHAESVSVWLAEEPA